MTVPRIETVPTIHPNAQPGVYVSALEVDGRAVYFARGLRGVVLSIRRPREDETDAQVISALRSLYLAATREPWRLISPSGEASVVPVHPARRRPRPQRRALPQ